MSDFSIFSLFTAGLACLAPLASAYTTPVGDAPKGNPISMPGLNSVVPVDQAYTVTWEPTTQGTVSLVLLKGPSSNAVPQYAIAEKIPNSGTYSWTPSDALEPGQTGYGIQLIDDATGQYQYTTQFGISNPDYSASGSSSSAAASYGAPPTYGAPPAYGSSTAMTTAPTTSSAAKPTMPTSYVQSPPAYTSKVNTTSVVETTETSTKMPVGTAAPAPYPANNSTMVMPSASGSMKTTASMGASATGATPPAATGAASGLAASFGGLVVAAGVAVFAL